MSNRPTPPQSAPPFLNLENKSAEQIADETKDLPDAGGDTNEEPDVAETENAPETADEQAPSEGVEVELIHHYTPPDGEARVPGDKVTLHRSLAAALIGGKFAVSVSA
jgi:hypothetical protein